jgi:hypothetical protein
MDLVLYVVGGGLIAFLPALLDWVFTRRRVRMLRQEAENLGFSFQDGGKPFEGSDVQGLTILEEDPSALTLHVMRRVAGDCDALVFDLAHYIPGCANLMETTVAGFRCPSRQLPVFEIGEKGFAHRLGDASEGKVDLEVARKFAKKLFVHCSNEAASHDFLTAEKIEQLASHMEHFRIESSHEWILIYRPGRRTAPQGLCHFIQTASAIASTLLGRAPATARQSSGG